MNITFITPSDNLSGGTRVIASHALALQARGHRVHIVSNAPDRPAWPQRLRQAWAGDAAGAPVPGHIALSGVPHTVLDRPRPVTAADLPDADIVVATWWETAVWMHALPRSKGAPVHLIQGYEVWVPGSEPRVQAALRLPNHKVVVSAGLAQEIEAAVGPLGLRVVPNAVDLQQFDAPARGRQSPPTVGFLYSLAPMKGTDQALAACALLRERCPALRILTLGEDAPCEALPLPPGARHHRRPAQSELAGLYAACDAWLFASRRDSFGLPILEAMACRTPVVGVSLGAAPDLLQGGAGVLVPPADVPGLAEGLARLLLGPQALWQQASEAAHARAHAYSWAEASQAMEDVFEAALRSPVTSLTPRASRAA